MRHVASLKSHLKQNKDFDTFARSNSLVALTEQFSLALLDSPRKRPVQILHFFKHGNAVFVCVLTFKLVFSPLDSSQLHCVGSAQSEIFRPYPQTGVHAFSCLHDFSGNAVQFQSCLCTHLIQFTFFTLVREDFNWIAVFSCTCFATTPCIVPTTRARVDNTFTSPFTFELCSEALSGILLLGLLLVLGRHNVNTLITPHCIA